MSSLYLPGWLVDPLCRPHDLLLASHSGPSLFNFPAVPLEMLSPYAAFPPGNS
jgi:hypothetical protein